MRTRTRLLLVSLLLIPLPLPPSAAAEPRATGPDDEGAWVLAFDVTLVEARTASARLDVLREDAEGNATGARDLGTKDLPAGTSTVEIPFLPAEGAGRYTVALLLDGAIAGAVTFDVETAAAAQEIAFDVPDAPTWVNLTNDDVNADGKTKSPGEALVTRAIVTDDNGLAELDGLRFAVERAGVTVDSGALVISAPANATAAPVELRYDRAPLAAGAYTLRLSAHKGGALRAEASRTFTIREVAPSFVSGAIGNVTPDEDRTIATAVVLADRNGAVGPGALDARVYRGSARAEGSGFAATLGAPTRLADANGAARWSYPLDLRVPARATAGSMRVSLYHNDTLLASLPFDVLALPQLRSVAAANASGKLVLTPNATGEGHLTAILRGEDGRETRAASTSLAAPLVLAPPARGAPLRWTLELRAREGGPVVAERNGTWTAPFDGPALVVSGLHVRKHLPATWAIDAGGRSLADAEANVTFARWDGVPEPTLRASVANGRVRVDGPRDLAAGRYEARLMLSWPNGSVSEATWSFEAGPWIELALGAPVVDGTVARVPVENVGSLPIARFLVEAAPAARVKLVVGNATLEPREVGGRHAFSGATLEPGERGELIVELPAGPRAAGRASVSLRVMARLGS